MTNPNPSPKTRIKKGEIRNPTGKGGLTPIKREVRKLTVEAYREIIDLVITNDIDQLQEIIRDKSQPALKVAIAACFATAIKKGDIATVERIIERIIGKVPDVVRVHQTGAIGTTKLDSKDDKQKVRAILAKLESDV